MQKNTFSEILKYILVIGSGALTFWTFSLFHPFSANYPPSVLYQPVSTINQKPDSVLAAPGSEYARTWLGEFFLGKHYRFLWTTPVKAPVLDLKTEAGGLSVIKMGGGMQTTSFTLRDQDSVTYSLRSVNKDPISVIPQFLWPTAIGTFIRDQVSATDPFALRPVLYLTRLAGIAEMDAKLVFVKKSDPAFAAYHLKGNGFYFLSRKPQPPRNHAFATEKDGRFYATAAMLKALNRNSSFRIDTLAFLKCRLFDLYIGDWDRHAGQWDWLGFKVQNDTVFRPIPKDRDQAFGYYADGVFPFLLSRNFGIRKITTFTPDYLDIEGFSQNGSDLDARFLKPLPEEKFIRMAWELNRIFSEKALQRVVAFYPKPAQAFAQNQRLPALLARRKNLPQAAAIFARTIKHKE